MTATRVDLVAVKWPTLICVNCATLCTCPLVVSSKAIAIKKWKRRYLRSRSRTYFKSSFNEILILMGGRLLDEASFLFFTMT